MVVSPRIVNHTPFPAAAITGIGPNGGPVLTVIVKATFDIPDGGEAPVSAEQTPVFTADVLETATALRFESDLVIHKPRADIALVGHAHSRGQRPVQALDVTLAVGKISKTIRVIGDRRWRCFSRFLPVFPSLPRPFTRMPLVYERAFGGVEPETGERFDANPMGVGFHTRKLPRVLHDAPLPNLEDPRHLISGWRDRPPPVGLRFCSQLCGLRRGDLGESVPRDRRIPHDGVEDGNAAHPELRYPGYLEGGAEVRMVNLLPGGGTRRFHLSSIRVHCAVGFRRIPQGGLPDTPLDDVADMTGNQTLVRMNLDTLCFLPDERRFYQVWRGGHPLVSLNADEVETIHVSRTFAGEHEGERS